ncbi:hypothetical protein KP755_10700 [Streptococcus equi subsp. equi]|uniref:hypothetical protein n=1 Tax=Streptococcus equi TaxID=1336 RepID=UPI0002F9005D|nr:hypothetical protein [Streptococcus equi]MBT1222667.1 hypothetical protein [Streptococcus equi subsp. equi]MCD3478571.1 hypothetical protein [Streptococcus equi subsp. equi]MCD3549462.1 hypothetical protein [Streptococcus equi subsp. equi]NCA37283.1 hypothetical protein [Streptococcus equi]
MTDYLPWDKSFPKHSRLIKQLILSQISPLAYYEISSWASFASNSCAGQWSIKASGTLLVK